MKQKELLKNIFKFINKENVSYLRKFEEFRVTRENYRIKCEKLKKIADKTTKRFRIN